MCLLVGQEKIVRAFAEIMKNMSRMKTCVRPAMCKPYGKQSEALQKSKYFLSYAMIKNILTRRKESDTYLATVSRNY